VKERIPKDSIRTAPYVQCQAKTKIHGTSRHQMLAPNAVVGNWQWQLEIATGYY
jgi:hypothetical protein